jgi:glycosyltransferase involved in cell wall biosynthesis
VKVLLLPAGGPGVASSRFRVYQYVAALRSAGFRVDLLPGPGPGAPLPARYLLRVLRAAATSDVVIVQKRPLGRAFLALRAVNPRVIYDVDDALWVPPPGGIDASTLDRARRGIARAMRLSRAVIAGNPWLAAYAARHARRVRVIETPIDTDLYRPRPIRAAGGPVVLGWIGHPDNLRYLELVAPALTRVGRRLGPRVELVVVSSRPPAPPPGLATRYQPWTLESEVEALQQFDVGLMPLADDEWCRGKCMFKAIQYMAVGTPAVCSPVGMPRDEIADGVDGFLAATEDEWVDALDRLACDPGLRARAGEAARRTAVTRFSLDAAVPRLVQAIEEAAR